MAVSLLTTVSDPTGEPVWGEIVDLGRAPGTAARRIQQLQQEARVLAHEQIEGFARDLDEMAQRAAEIADGGEAYPVGARELASRIAEDLPHKAQLLTALLSRGG
jgi:hypothetical protein